MVTWWQQQMIKVVSREVVKCNLTFDRMGECREKSLVAENYTGNLGRQGYDIFCLDLLLTFEPLRLLLCTRYNCLTFVRATCGNFSNVRYPSSPVCPCSCPLKIREAVIVDIPMPSPMNRMTFFAIPWIVFGFSASFTLFFPCSNQNFESSWGKKEKVSEIPAEKTIEQNRHNYRTILSQAPIKYKT